MYTYPLLQTKYIQFALINKSGSQKGLNGKINTCF